RPRRLRGRAAPATLEVDPDPRALGGGYRRGRPADCAALLLPAAASRPLRALAPALRGLVFDGGCDRPRRSGLLRRGEEERPGRAALLSGSPGAVPRASAAAGGRFHAIQKRRL